MGDKFFADPDALRRVGSNIIDAAQNFRANNQKIFDNIADLIERSYISEGSRAIANDILQYKDDLENMARVIEDYGNYSTSTGATVVRNEENIADTYKVTAGGN